MRQRSNPRYLLLSTTLAFAACNSPDSTDTVEWREAISHLPSGVAISVEITTPIEAAKLPDQPFEVTGFTQIGEPLPLARTTLAYVVDVSGSAEYLDGCGGDLNADDLADSVLDCEIAALLEVDAMALATGTVADVGAAVFGTFGATADVQPGGTNADRLTSLTRDLDGDSIADIEQVLRSMQGAFVGEFTAQDVDFATSYGAGLEAILPVLHASVQPNKVVVFVSDGQNNTAPHIDEILPLPAGTIVHAFAIGKHATCEGPTDFGSLQDIADATSGSCTEVPDLDDLPNILPAVVAVELTGLELTADGASVPIDKVVPAAPPQSGPAALKFETTVGGLAPGEHVLCATARAVDALGVGDVSECKSISIAE